MFSVPLINTHLQVGVFATAGRTRTALAVSRSRFGTEPRIQVRFDR
jgi:hypothetical protein